MTDYSYWIEGSAAAAQMLHERGLVPLKNSAQLASLELLIQRMLNAGMENFMLNANLQRIILWNDREPAQDRGADALCCWDTDPVNAADIKTVICIGTSAIKRGPDYLDELFIHELTHGLLRYSDHVHDEVFHSQMNHLLMIYNEKTGKSLKNDYCGLSPEEIERVAMYREFRADGTNAYHIPHGKKGRI